MTAVAQRRATFILADISGYTRFLADVGAAHRADLERGEMPAAYPLMTTLLDSIVESLVPPFELAKLEGDAVFAYADEDSLGMRGQAVIDCLMSCYSRFRAHVAETEAALTCSCDACVSVSGLDLKYVLHHGNYVLQTIARNSELLGPDVTTAHRMLKNEAIEKTGWQAYALLSAAAVEELQVPRGRGRELTLQYEHTDPVPALVLPLT